MLKRMISIVSHFTLILLEGLGHTGPAFFSALAEEALRFFGSIGLRKEES
jgi:hypothetical protein